MKSQVGATSVVPSSPHHHQSFTLGTVTLGRSVLYAEAGLSAPNVTRSSVANTRNAGVCHAAMFTCTPNAT